MGTITRSCFLNTQVFHNPLHTQKKLTFSNINLHLRIKAHVTGVKYFAVFS